MSEHDKPLIWLHCRITTPPFSHAARIQTGFLLRCVQAGESLTMPDSRPMPSIGKGCHELRIADAGTRWRVIYRIDEDAIVVAEVFRKTTQHTPHSVIETAIKRLRRYDHESGEAAKA